MVPSHLTIKLVQWLLMIYCNPIILSHLVYIVCQELQSITNAWPAALVLSMLMSVFLHLMLQTFLSCLERQPHVN